MDLGMDDKAKAVFRCRIVDIDYHMATPIKGMDYPFSHFSSSVSERVPVIRIFGSTPAGQKTCLHIHGGFPYLLIPSPSSDSPSASWLKQFGRSINHALQVSLGAVSKTTSHSHVWNISVITGRPIYGYHEEEQFFIKIFLYNPAFIKRLADLLLAGAVMNQALQCHESHIPFVLQIMMDYNLYGMNFITVSAIKFRSGADQHVASKNSSFSSSFGSVSLSQRIWDITSLSDDMLIHESKESTCELEGDVLVADILNTQFVKESAGGYPGLASIHEEEKKRRERLDISVPLTLPSSPVRECSLLHLAELRHRDQLHSFISGIEAPCTPLTQTFSQEDEIAVDEKAVQYSMDLSQRIQETMLSSSDADLLDVLIELAHSSTYPQSTQEQKEPVSPSSSSSLFSSTPHDLQRSLLLSELNEADTDSSQLETESEYAKRGSRLSSVDLLDGTEKMLFEDDDDDDDMIPGNQQHSQSSLKNLKETQESLNKSPTLISSLVLSCTQEVNNESSQRLGNARQSAQLPILERRKLLQLCSSELGNRQWEQEEQGNEDSIEEEERESILMTQPVWDDVEDSDMHSPQVIPQVDGTNEQVSADKDKSKRQHSSSSSCDPSKQGKLNLSLKEFRKRKQLSKLHVTEEQVDNSIPVELAKEQNPCSSTTDVSRLTRYVTVDVTRLPVTVIEKYSASLPSSIDPQSQDISVPSLTPPTVISPNLCSSPTASTISASASLNLSSSSRNLRRKRKPSEPEIVASTTTECKRPCMGLSFEEEMELAIKESLRVENKDKRSAHVAEESDSTCALGKGVENFRELNIESSFELCSDKFEYDSVGERKDDNVLCQAGGYPSGIEIEPESKKIIEEGQMTINEQELLSSSSTGDRQSDCKKVHGKSNLIITSDLSSVSQDEKLLLVEEEKVDKDFSLSSFFFASESETESIELGNDHESGGKTDDECKEASKGSNEMEKTVNCPVDESIQTRKIANNRKSLNSEVEKSVIITPVAAPPSIGYLIDTSVFYNLPSAHHPELFYSNPDDVQTAKNVGASSVHILSKMPYNLLPFHPSYSFTSDSIQSLLEHWRMIYRFLDSSLGPTQALPPQCCPCSVGVGMEYTANDHRHDVLLKATFLEDKEVIITPAKLPPSAAALCLKTAERKRGTGKNTETEKTEMFTLQADKPTQLFSDNSMIEAATPNNIFGYKLSHSKMEEIDHQVQHLTTLSVEVHAASRGSLLPDPEYDPVLFISYYIHDDWPEPLTGDVRERTGLLAVDLSEPEAFKRCNFASPVKVNTFHTIPLKEESPLRRKCQTSTKAHATVSPIKGHKPPTPSSVLDQNSRPYLEHCGLQVVVSYADTELDLFVQLVQLVQEVDPDILVGYEIQMSSWGYLNERATNLGFNLFGQISRIPVNSLPNKNASASPAVNYMMYYGLTSEVVVTGRILLDLWRLIKNEVSLTSYSYENVSFHVLHERTPHFAHKTLTQWYQHPTRLYRHQVVEYYSRRSRGNFRLIESFNLIGRTSEMARLYGIEFYNVLSRGSQYRVESMLLRLARQENYVAVSPSIHQRARMAAPEYIPLILEPESRFYSNPVLVLDFQSLYPSMIIAHNYCYSTCLGKVDNISKGGEYKFGACTLRTSPEILMNLKDDVTISPSGAVFVKPHIRRGVMPRMLEEILTTRIMVKQSMKMHKDNKALLRMLDARQLGLKLIANVTYGYTAANYSGRMPCVEVADSIVSKGRETLQRAIQLVNSTPEWKASVVYGDTDSLFVLLENASKDEAFRVGREICDRVTADNPKPVKLKFEKVYLPCVLQTKKRYVGYMYESPDQLEPVFDAKGIETVRRDSCPAVSMILEKSLKLLFSTMNVSLVKSYVQHQCSKILSDRVSIQNFTFAREYRGMSGYRPTASVPALELSRQSVSNDRRSEPRVGKRVPYVIVYGSPGLPLIQLACRPGKVLATPTLRLNGTYYITKQILPALDRVFALMGVDVFSWYKELPRIQRPLLLSNITGVRKGTIGQYFTSQHCVICEQVTVNDEVCRNCRKDILAVTVTLSQRYHQSVWAYSHLCQLCQNCCGGIDSEQYAECLSLDCPVLHKRQRRLQQLKASESFQNAI